MSKTRYYDPKDPLLKLTKWGYFVQNDSLLPVRAHQIYDEIHQKERELAALLYFEKDRTRDIR